MAADTSVAGSVLTFLLSLIGGGAGAFAIVIFLAKRLVEQRLQGDMERLRAELTERTEGLKTSLSIYAHEQTVSLSRVDNQRASAIHTVYASMREWQTRLSTLVSDTPEQEPHPSDVYQHAREATRAAKVAGEAFEKTLADNAIYIDRVTFERIREGSDAALDAVRSLSEQIATAEHFDLVEESVDQIEDDRRLIADIITKQTFPAMDALVAHLRQVLGTDR